MENDEMVSIEPILSFRPHLQRTFAVRCRHHHRILTTVSPSPPNPPSSAAGSTTSAASTAGNLSSSGFHETSEPPPFSSSASDDYNPVNNFVGVRNYHDRKVLVRSKHRIRVSNMINVCDVAAVKKGYRRGTSMRELADSILKLKGVKKDTTVWRSNWGAESLSEGQVMYACLDAFIAFELGKKLQGWDKITDH